MSKPKLSVNYRDIFLNVQDKKVYPLLTVSHMKAILLSFFLLPAICFAEMLAFIGSPISVEKTSISCEGLASQKPKVSGLEEVCMDSVFRFRYKILEAVFGNPKDREIQFLGAYHYRGLPDYVIFEPALVILRSAQGRLVLYSIEPVRSRENSWWVCQDPDDNENCGKWKSVKEVAANAANDI